MKYTVVEISAVGALSRSSGLSEVILCPKVCFLVQPSISHAFALLGNVRQLVTMLLLDICVLIT